MCVSHKPKWNKESKKIYYEFVGIFDGNGFTIYYER